MLRTGPLARNWKLVSAYPTSDQMGRQAPDELHVQVPVEDPRGPELVPARSTGAARRRGGRATRSDGGGKSHRNEQEP